MSNFLGNPKVQFFDAEGAFLAGGKLYFYEPSSVTLTNTYPTLADADALTNPNANPIILDSRGEAVVVTADSVKMSLFDSNDVLIYTVDNVGEASGTGNNAVFYVEEEATTSYFTITSGASGNAPSIAITSSSANKGMKVETKGTGTLELSGGSSGEVVFGNTSTGAIAFNSDTTFHSNLSVSGTFLSNNATLSGTLSGTTLSAGAMAAGSLSAQGSVKVLLSGYIIMFAGASVPSGWVELTGQAISRTTYDALFAQIGTTYGAGDGSTTFTLPDMRRRVAVGRGGTGTFTLGNTAGNVGGTETITLATSELPAHTHTNFAGTSSSYASGGGITLGNSLSTETSGSAGSGGAHSNVQPSIVMMYIMKLY